MKTVRVDFNTIGVYEDGVLSALQNHASSRLFIGDMVLAIEDPGYTCIASVIAVEPNGIVRLAVDPTTWRDPVAA